MVVEQEVQTKTGYPDDSSVSSFRFHIKEEVKKTEELPQEEEHQLIIEKVSAQKAFISLLAIADSMSLPASVKDETLKFLKKKALLAIYRFPFAERSDFQVYEISEDEDRRVEFLPCSLIQKTKKRLNPIFKGASQKEIQEELDCLRERMARGEKAFDKLVVATLRIIEGPIYRFARFTDFKPDEMVSEAEEAIMKAVALFKPGKDCELSTYAGNGTYIALRREFRRRKETARLSDGMRKLLKRAKKTEEKLAQVLGRWLTLQELAREMDEDAERLQMLRLVEQPPTSLEKQGDPEDPDLILKDLIEDPCRDTEGEAVRNVDMKRGAAKALALVTRRQKIVLTARFGDESKSVEEKARGVGISSRGMWQTVKTAGKRVERQAPELKDLVV